MILYCFQAIIAYEFLSDILLCENLSASDVSSCEDEMVVAECFLALFPRPICP